MQAAFPQKLRIQKIGAGLVLIRGRDGKGVVRELLGRDGNVAVVCRPENADAIRRGDLPEPMVGVRPSDVFAYDETAAGRLDGDSVDWTMLRPMFPR